MGNFSNKQAGYTGMGNRIGNPSKRGSGEEGSDPGRQRYTAWRNFLIVVALLIIQAILFVLACWLTANNWDQIRAFFMKLFFPPTSDGPQPEL